MAGVWALVSVQEEKRKQKNKVSLDMCGNIRQACGGKLAVAWKLLEEFQVP